MSKMMMVEMTSQKDYAACLSMKEEIEMIIVSFAADEKKLKLYAFIDFMGMLDVEDFQKVCKTKMKQVYRMNESNHLVELTEAQFVEGLSCLSGSINGRI